MYYRAAAANSQIALLGGGEAASTDDYPKPP